jgi:hypothetical protein
MGGGMPPPQLFAQIASLAQSMPRTAMDKVREAMRLLDEAREEDDKISPNVSMAMSIIRHGPKSLDKYGLGSPSDQPEAHRNSK